MMGLCNETATSHSNEDVSSDKSQKKALKQLSKQLGILNLI